MESPGREEDDFIEHLFLQEDLCPNIAEHVTQCTSLFHLYMTAPDIVPDPGIILEQRTRFLQWASQTDVYGPLNASLDYRLRFSPTLVETIHKLLDEICGTLVSSADDPSYWDNYVDLAKDNTLKITEGIARTVTQLLRLSNTVRQSAIADRAREIGRYTDDEDANNAIAELRLYTECYIRFRFPMAPESLRSALVEANAMRLRRLYYERSYRRRITLSAQNPQTTPTIVRLPRRKGSALVIRFGSGILPKPVTTKGILEPAGPPSMPVMNATTARNSAIRASHTESRIEPPRPESALVNNRMSFPPIPPTHECPYCGLSLKFTSTAETMLWRNHVTRDLEPFVCVFADCLKADQQEAGPQTFETSKDWITHMQRLTIQYQEHSIKVHSVPETYVKLVSDAAQRPGLKRVQECPFGDDFQPSGELEPSAVFSTQALESHVAAHIKEIALLTLQKLPSDVDETAEGIGSHQPLTDSGSGFASPRASMYSVLYDETLDFEHGSTEDASHNLDHRDQGISASCLLEDDRIRSRTSLQDSHGWSILHLAVHSRDLATINTLLDSSAFGDTLVLFDENGLTAEEWLDLKPTSHHYKAISNLAFVKSRCCRAVTGLRQAAFTGNVPMIKLLLRLGHNINGMNSGRRTALYHAAEKGMFSIVDLLLQMGADPNVLPTGRKTWQDFVSDGDILLRLNQVSHEKRNTDARVKRQIRIALRAQGQPSALERSAPFVPDQSISPSPMPDEKHCNKRKVMSGCRP
ncbi:hypothetical protein BDV25DRAFT_167726 [Aspergillus avenaceus]|uniref:Uncharacterized protein n=1 Tax=Aspergillus avenaceus TaxID=36643 RepID=A0A5N6UAS2_ASPAV|nr:hypothetical protein BDV25DRAFT_167726 [Aspergillus avenaceus]